MWWVAWIEPERRQVGAPADAAPGRVRLRHGREQPAVLVHRADVAGCRLLSLGCCTNADRLPSAARAVAGGDWDALTSLDGSQVAIADAGGEVAVVGDLAGQCGVFYGLGTGARVVVSSCARRVANELGMGLDRGWLATRMVAAGAVDVWQTGSPWEGVSSLPPGWALRISPQGTVTSRRLGGLPTPERTVQEGASLLRQALSLAVDHRRKGAVRPTADLSGGLDSATICTLTTTTPGPRVRALTVASAGVEDVGFAAAAAAHMPLLAHEVVEEPDDLLPYSGLERVPLVDEPATWLTVAARERWWLGEIAARGSDLHLSGDGGDGVLVAPPAYLADLSSPLRLVTLWRHSYGWARVRHRSPGELMRSAVRLRRTGYPAALRAAARALRCGHEPPVGWPRLVSWLGTAAMPWASGEARTMVAEALCRHADEHRFPQVPGGFGIGDSVAWMSLVAFGRSQRTYHDFAARCGVNHHAPFLDDGVIRACWSVPASARTTPGRAKPLLGRAMAGRVPVVVLGRRSKGDYTRLHYLGLRHNAKTLYDLLASSWLSDLGLIDGAAVTAELRRGVAGLPIRLGAFDMVLATEVWLRSLQEETGGTGAWVDSP